jgi:hypothetical protein
MGRPTASPAWDPPLVTGGAGDHHGVADVRDDQQIGGDQTDGGERLDHGLSAEAPALGAGRERQREPRRDERATVRGGEENHL